METMEYLAFYLGHFNSFLCQRTPTNAIYAYDKAGYTYSQGFLRVIGLPCQSAQLTILSEMLEKHNQKSKTGLEIKFTSVPGPKEGLNSL